MRIIKLEVEVASKKYGTRVLRQAVGLDKSAIKKIKQFIDYVKKVSSLKGDYELFIDGFNIGSNETVKILKESKVYRLQLRQDEEESSNQEQSQPAIGQSEEQQQCLEQSQSQIVEQQPKKKKNTPRQNLKKSHQIIRKKIEKKVAQSHKKKQQSQSPLSDESEEQEDQKHQIRKTGFASKGKQGTKQANLPKKQQRQQIRPKINIFNRNQKKDSTQIKINNKKKEVIQSDSSSSELPVLKKEPKNALIIQQKKVQHPSKQNVLPIQKKDNHPAFKKAIIRDSSSQSSPSKQKTPEIKPKKLQTTQKPLNYVNESKPQNLKLPPALRNKIQANKFQKHQQNQWIVVTKQKYDRWQQLGHKTLCQPPNKIRFKIVQLDEQRFIPVKSNWITGEVTSVLQNGSINLANVDQEGKQFRKSFEIPEMNMDQLQIFRPLANKEQLDFLLGAQQQKEKQIQKPQPIKNEITFLQEQPNSVQKFVCGQVNYYFSDKNYLTDCYMQLHANSHPQKYMKVSFMLNFPKIKKVLRDEDKLLQYLRGDQKYESRNFQVDFENKLIRKKNIVQQTPNQSKNEEIKVQEEEREVPVQANDD